MRIYQTIELDNDVGYYSGYRSYEFCKYSDSAQFNSIYVNFGKAEFGIRNNYRVRLSEVLEIEVLNV